MPEETKPEDAKVQVRSITISQVKFRAASGDKPATVSGYASVFNKLSEPLWEYGGGREMIAPGAFTGVLPTADVRLLINHDSNLVLARNVSGTLTLTQDDTGLYFEATLGNQTYAADLAESMRRGDISQCSFAFCVQDSDTQTMNGEPVVVIRSVSDLSDVSIVTYPAYPDASASVRKSRELRFENPAPKQKEEEPTVPAEVLSRARQLALLEIE